MACPACSERHKERSDEEVKKLTTRLNRIEGQIKGVKKMLEDNRYCPDILIQVSAIQSSLNSFSKELLGAHLRSCVVDDIKKGDENAIDELLDLLKKLMK